METEQILEATEVHSEPFSFKYKKLLKTVTSMVSDNKKFCFIFIPFLALQVMKLLVCVISLLNEFPCDSIVLKINARVLITSIFITFLLFLDIKIEFIKRKKPLNFLKFNLHSSLVIFVLLEFCFIFKFSLQFFSLAECTKGFFLSVFLIVYGYFLLFFILFFCLKFFYKNSAFLRARVNLLIN